MGSLRELGLSEYETRTYEGLLESGPVTAQETSNRTEVPVGRIYDVLNNLAQYGMVKEWENRRPKLYSAVEPAIALKQLLAVKKRQLDAQASQYEATVSEVAAAFDTIDPTQRSCYSATVCLEASRQLLIDQLAKATHEVLIALQPQAFVGANDEDIGIDNVLSDPLTNGVDISLLIHPAHPVVETGGAHVPMIEHEAIEMRECAAVTTTVACVDDDILVTEIPSAFQQQNQFLLIDADTSEYIAGIRNAFTRHWERTSSNSADITQHS